MIKDMPTTFFFKGDLISICFNVNIFFSCTIVVGTKKDWYVTAKRRQKSVPKNGMLEITEFDLTGRC